MSKMEETPAVTAPGDAANASQMQISVPPDLGYAYYDLFNLFVGLEEVVLEFGNRHRAVQNRAQVVHRAVLSVPSAIRLAQALQQALQQAQQRVQALQAEAAQKAEKK